MNSFIHVTDDHYLCTAVPRHYTLTAKTKFQISLLAEPIVTVYFLMNAWNLRSLYIKFFFCT